MEDENPQEEEKLKMFHPVHTLLSKFVTNFEAIDLHVKLSMKAKLVYEITND